MASMTPKIAAMQPLFKHLAGGKLVPADAADRGLRTRWSVGHVLDDTIERRCGAKIAAKGRYRDPVRSSHDHFVKASGLQSWDHYPLLIGDCDRQISRLPDCQISSISPPSDNTQPSLSKNQKKDGANAPNIAHLREILAQTCGTNLTRLPALTHYSVLQLIGEIGTDLSAWPSEKHFVALAWLASRSKDSGK